MLSYSVEWLHLQDDSVEWLLMQDNTVLPAQVTVVLAWELESGLLDGSCCRLLL